MRKIVILAGLLAGAALFPTGTPAKAWVGCSCVRLRSVPVCVAGVVECTAIAGVCLAPCDYVAPKKAVKHHKKKAKKVKKEEKK